MGRPKGSKNKARRGRRKNKATVVRAYNKSARRKRSNGRTRGRRPTGPLTINGLLTIDLRQEGDQFREAVKNLVLRVAQLTTDFNDMKAWQATFDEPKDPGMPDDPNIALENEAKEGQ